MRSINYLFLLILLLIAAPAGAQKVQDSAVPRDTARYEEPEVVSPRGAMLRSFVLPGWGQAAVGSPGRGGLYFAMETGSLWMVYRSQIALGQAKEQDRFLREIGELEVGEDSELVRSRKRQVEDWITMSIFVLLLSGADAYVGAQLADFGDHIGVAPTSGGGAELRVSMPVGRR